MNRRELLGAAGAAAAAVVPGATAEALDPEPKPFLLVLKTDKYVGKAAADRIREQMGAVLQKAGMEGLQVVVLDGGMEIEALADPRCEHCRKKG